jgi:DNA-binding CsgD family transcriptional regulator/Tfp pilus assembly protein PilF
VVGATLLERERELSEVETLLGSALDGEGGALFVEGDAGIGKTALLLAAAASARAQGFDVLQARADALESELSFGVCMQLFHGLGRRANGDLFGGAAALAQPVLSGGFAFAGAPGEDRTLPLINGLYWLCANLAEQGPLLLSVDDAHWSDVPSLRFVHFLGRRLEGLPVALLVAARPTGASGVAAEVLGALTAQPEVALVRPGGLSAAAAAQLVESELGEFEPEFAEACLELSGGNPLYLRELLRAAVGQGLSPTGHDVDALCELRPKRIADSVLARVAAIGDGARRLAEVASVGGGRLHLRDTAALAGLDQRDAQAAADALAGLAILAPGEPLAFTHPLVHAAVYEAIPDASRADLHGRVGELMRDTGASDEAVAAHLLSASRRGGPWVLDVLESAATAAMSRGSPAAAAHYLRRALEEGPAGERRAQLLIALGLAETEAGDPEGASRLTDAVELLPAPEQRAGVLLGLGMTLTTQGDVAHATAAYERGLAEITGAESRVARDLEALCAVGLVHDREARAGALPRIEALLLDASIDDSPIGRLLLAQAAAERAYQGRSVGELRALVARALAPGLNEDDPATFWTYVVAAYAYDDCDDYSGAEEAIASALALARRRGSVVQVSAACHPQAFVNMRRGRIDAALTDAQISIEGAEYGWRLALPSSRAVLAEAYLERGELSEAAAAVSLPGGDEPWERLISYGWLLAARGRVELEQGDPDGALSTFMACGSLCEQSGLTNPAVISWRAGAALAASRLGRLADADSLVREELSLAQGYGAPRALGAAWRTLGLVVGDSRAIEPLRESVAVLEASEARLEHARTLVDLGAALRRLGHRREARSPLREGLDLAHRCGASALADRALTDLQAAGARPRRHELTGVDALTPSERRVVGLAAEGLGNPQIAQALFVTRRTVEMHLTNAYRKLGIGSREELVSALAK